MRSYAVVLLLIVSIVVVDSRKEIQEVSIKLEQPEFFLEDISVSNIIKACDYYNVKYPKIIASQAILESGNFKSKIFKEYNNPFGLYNSKAKDYYKFNHWTESILFYKDNVQYKYKGGDYYKFLKELPYAEDSTYIQKLKQIEKWIEKK